MDKEVVFMNLTMVVSCSSKMFVVCFPKTKLVCSLGSLLECYQIFENMEVAIGSVDLLQRLGSDIAL